MRITFGIFLLALTTMVYGQKIKIEQGSLSALKGETEINVEFTYDNMAVGKYDQEEDYIADKKKSYNDKEPGSGDKWQTNWVEDRKNRYEPKFFELFNKDAKVEGGNKPNAKYTLIFHTSFTEPGFNVGVMRKNANINAEATIVETANRNKIVCKISIVAAQGGAALGYDFDTGQRIMEAYAVCGKRLNGRIREGK
jgi:hypothetical protein